jgi:hypothetical protein
MAGDRVENHSHAVPVLPRPKASTRIGTDREHFRRSMSVSFGVNMSVTGLGVYSNPEAMVEGVVVDVGELRESRGMRVNSARSCCE